MLQWLNIYNAQEFKNVGVDAYIDPYIYNYANYLFKETAL